MLLPGRPPPLPDELLGSWLMRLAQDNTCTLSELTRLMGTSPLIDFDRGPTGAVFETITRHTGIETPRLRGMTLFSLRGKLFASRSTRSALQWIALTSRKNGFNLDHGQQVCPDCLHDDAVPYYRRFWRCSFVVVCPKHRCLLLDACPACERPIDYLRLDMARRPEPYQGSMACCGHCGLDLRRLSLEEWNLEWDMATSPPKSVVEEKGVDSGRHTGRLQALLAFQARLGQGLDSGCFTLGAESVSILEALQGMAQLVRVLGRVRRAKAFRDAVTTRSGGTFAPISCETQSNKWMFDQQRASVRTELLGQLAWLLEDWPERFRAVRRETGIARSYLLDGNLPSPSWYVSDYRQ